MPKDHGKHAPHVKKVEDAFDKAGGGRAGLAAALHQVIANARALEEEQAAQRKEALDHLDANIDDMVNAAG